jgi:hypothetical protein
MNVREAARRTLDAGSARVAMRSVLDPPATHPLIAAMFQSREGVADLARRRVRLDVTDRTATRALAEHITSKWPWLDDDEDDEEDDDVNFVTVFADGCRYVGVRDRWSLSEDGNPGGRRTQDDPTWILDALRGARGAHRAGSEDVRGTDCERYTLDPVDLRAADGAIELPEHGTLDRPTLRGDVWIDADGLVRRVTWRQPPRVRRRVRPPKPPAIMWHITELWDFGLPVEIDVPRAEPPADPGSLLGTTWEIGTLLWRKRADYRRRQAQNP